MDVIRRARALLAVAASQTWTQAARTAGYKRGASVGQLVERFNHRGLVVLLIAPGRGRKRTYGSPERTRILAEVQRAPDRRQDATGTWSLATLEQALRKSGLPRVGATTIRRVLHEARYSLSAHPDLVSYGHGTARAQSGHRHCPRSASPRKTTAH